MRGHPHLQPLWVSPGLRLYSDSGTQWPAARRGHDSAGFWRPPPRQPLRSAGRGWADRGSRALVCIYTMHARGSSYHRRSRLGEDQEAGAMGGSWPGRRGSALLSGSDAELGEVPPTRPVAGRSPSRGTPGRTGRGLERSWKPSPPPGSGVMVGGNGMREAPRPYKSSADSQPISCHLAAGARASQHRDFTGNTNVEAEAK